jgi:hypothetical protein
MKKTIIKKAAGGASVTNSRGRNADTEKTIERIKSENAAKKEATAKAWGPKGPATPKPVSDSVKSTIDRIRSENAAGKKNREMVTIDEQKRRDAPKKVTIKSKPMDYMKDADPIRTVEGLKPSSREPEKKAPTKVAGKSMAKKRAAFNSEKRDAVISSTRPTLTVKKPTAPGVSTAKPDARKYTAAEVKIMNAIQKGKNSNGTVKTGAQAKIASIRKRADAINKRAAKKSSKK